DVARILIVGGGIAALSAAIALRRQGYAPELVESPPDWRAEGAAVTLQRTACGRCADSGWGDVLDAGAATLPAWSFHDRHGQPLCETDMVDLWGDVGPCLGVTRRVVQEALRAGAAGLPRR